MDPQPAVRAGLTMLLRTEPGLVPIGAASEAGEGIGLVERLRGDGASAAGVAHTLWLDRRKVGGRIERLLGRLRSADGRTAVLS